jgi:subtilisin family serine protease
LPEERLMGSKRAVGLVSVATVLIMVLAAFASVPAGAGAKEEHRVIVMFDDEMDEKTVKDAGGEVVKGMSMLPGIIALMTEGEISSLKKNSKIASIEYDYRVYVQKKPASPPGQDKDKEEDVYKELQWGVDQIDAEKAWATSTGNGVKVAVLDTGIDYNHPELSGVYAGGYDFVNNDGIPMDDNGHGTHCAGVIAAYKHFDLDDEDQNGVVGVAYEVNLYGVKVLDSDGSGWTSDVIDGIEWCRQNSIEVISMSLGGNVGDSSLEDKLDDAYGDGIVIVAASGNDGKRNARSDTVDYPARYSSVIAVGATDSRNKRASFSSTGSAMELVAPGVDVLSTYLNSQYATGSGTSMATPHVAGVVALVLSLTPGTMYDTDSDGWDPAEVRKLLQDTADDLGSTGWDVEYGYGLVDAEEAVSLATTAA